MSAKPIGKTPQEAAQELIDRYVLRLKDGLPNTTHVEGQLLQGYPKSELIKCAERWICDLLIVGSRGLKGMQRLMIGSVSHALLMAVHCSVRIARRSKSGNNSAERVCLAIDDSEFSDHVVSRMASRPWSEGTEFLCLTAVPTLTQFVQEAQNSYEMDSLNQFRDDQRHQAEERLKKVVQIMTTRLPNAKTSHEVIDGDPRVAIVERAQAWNSGLIVTGCKGKNWVDRVLIGSVSEAIAVNADCSVEVIKK
jgi:nucleotide-binding universal stress UspA family protein